MESFWKHNIIYVNLGLKKSKKCGKCVRDTMFFFGIMSISFLNVNKNEYMFLKYFVGMRIGK